jgi:hypothetical protein
MVALRQDIYTPPDYYELAGRAKAPETLQKPWFLVAPASPEIWLQANSHSFSALLSSPLLQYSAARAARIPGACGGRGGGRERRRSRARARGERGGEGVCGGLGVAKREDSEQLSIIFRPLIGLVDPGFLQFDFLTRHSAQQAVI